MFTESERTILEAYKSNEMVALTGWTSTRACAWTSEIQLDTGMETEEFRSNIVSLCLKGVIWGNGIIFGLTQKGIEALREEEAA